MENIDFLCFSFHYHTKNILYIESSINHKPKDTINIRTSLIEYVHLMR